MSGVLDGVNQRTQLVGKNRLELLLFKLGNTQRFGINVFKVREVIPCPTLTMHPNAHTVVRGIANIRGQTVPVIDLAMGLGLQPIAKPDAHFVILTEFNRKVQGFLVMSVERIINLNWEEILPPPKGMEKGGYMTAVAKVDKELVEIVDVEKVMAEVLGTKEEVSSNLTEAANAAETDSLRRVMVADDSMVARKQVQRALQQIGVECVMARDGKDALMQLQQWAEDGDVSEHIDMLISDIEMPEMDGYTLTTEIRKDHRLKNLKVMLHSSLSGVFNEAMVEKAGADYWLPKFHADELATAVMDKILPDAKIKESGAEED